MNLAELVDFCIEHDIDQTKVSCSYGHKEVVAVFEPQLTWVSETKAPNTYERNDVEGWTNVNGTKIYDDDDLQ